MRIGLQIPDFTWSGGPTSLGPDLAAIARTADDVGFDFIGVMDHFFQIPVIGPADQDMLEAYTTLGFIAAHTSRANLLTLVTGVAYRHPGVLAKQVTTLDVLSGGRAWLGIGAAWNDEEAKGLGIPFPPLRERFERLEETLRIVRQMFDGSEEPYAGKHYELTRPLNKPSPLRRPPILIGGSGERKTLRLVAKYADACNFFPTPDIDRKLDVLRTHCEREGRDYDSILKTVLYRFDVGENGEHVESTVEQLRRFSELGIQGVLGMVRGASTIKPLEIMGTDVIPVAASF